MIPLRETRNGAFYFLRTLTEAEAIESAHRNVIQQRLKLSGQRWSMKGVQQIANLRACKKSNQWDNLISIIKNAA